MGAVYLIGSLRNERVPLFANELEKLGVDVFDSWYAPGKTADDCWKEYEKLRGRSYAEALKGHAAQHVFEFDKFHLDRCDAAVLLAPAGRSGHLELGYVLGKNKPGYIVFPEEADDRWDVMLQFATGIFFSEAEFLHAAAIGRVLK